MKYKYKLNTDGKCVVCDFMREDYVLAEGEQSGETGVDAMPDIGTLHSKAYLDAQALVKYKIDRQSAYPSVGEQLDMMMKDKRDGTTTHQTACEAVKTAHPKPE
jgi:hypothetical protein